MARISLSNPSFFFKQKTAYEILSGLVGSEMCIRDSYFLLLNKYMARLFVPNYDIITETQIEGSTLVKL